MTKRKSLKSVFAENLIYYLKLRDKTQADLIRDLGYSSGSVSEWATGKKYPRMEKVQKIADYLEIEKYNLTESQDLQKSIRNDLKIPIIKRNILHNTFEVQEEFIDYLPSTGVSKSKKFFAIQIKDDRMAPDIQQGDFVIVRKQMNVPTNSIVLLHIGNDEIVTQVEILKENIKTIPLNTKQYKEQTFPFADVLIIGEVIELRRKFTDDLR